VRLLTWLGGPDLFDYCDILYDPSATVSADEFIEHAVSLLRARVPTAFLYLTNVRHDAVAYETLKATARPYKHSAAPYVPIQGSFEDYVSSLGRDQRRNVKRLLRRLESAGKTRFRLLRAGDPELVEVATRLVTLKKDRFARMGVRADLFSPEHTEYRLHQMRDDSHTAVVCLWLDATMIAAEMVFIYRDRMYLILASFDEAYARFAPGRLLDFHTLEVCHQGGLRVCDFCWGDERSKYQWTNLDMPMTTFVSNDVAGRLLIAAGATGRWTIDRIARLRRRGGVRPSPPAASDRRPPTVDPEALGTP
jgi:CelD/BcsL family acetyltransferase involved in cellulose biosynthesis